MSSLVPRCLPLLVTVLLLGSGLAGVEPETPASWAVPDNYRLVWADEFDGDGLPDATRWAYDTEANATGWYNHELQYYAAARPENARVADGLLTITARHEALTGEADYGGQRYSSARLITRGLADWTYGFFEIRARLPCGLGTWPAIWLLGASDVPYPANGEIDIMEQVGADPTTVFGTVHTTSTAGTDGDGGSVMVDDACAAFHDYQLTWTPDRLEFGVDGVVYHTVDNAGTNAGQWPFDAPQYLLLNLAIGGDFGGPVDDAIFPVAFEINYVRVYQIHRTDE